jgi:hypothetical protein
MNYNFESPERKGQNNVFTELQKNPGNCLIGVGYIGNVLHSIVQAAADILHVDLS